MLLSKLAKRGPKYVLGLNSGTSIDSLDWALVQCRGNLPTVKVVADGSTGYPPRLRDALRACAASDEWPKDRLVSLDQDYGRWLGQQIARIRLSLPPSQPIDLVASHGQTVGHWPQSTPRATLQIGDPDQIAKISALPVVSHFRHGDLAAGGEGAPLTPAINRILFAHSSHEMALLNLGGIANLSVIPPRTSKRTAAGTDCGPANILLDITAQRLLHRPYDRNGGTAAKGSVDSRLLAHLKKHPWFRTPLPSSCGREMFGEALVDNVRERFPRIPVADLLATFTALTAWCVKRALDQLHAKPHCLFLAGGGVHNTALITAIAKAVEPVRTCPLAETGHNPDTLEAVSFAILGYLFLREQPLDLHKATGAARPTILGRLTLP